MEWQEKESEENLEKVLQQIKKFHYLAARTRPIPVSDRIVTKRFPLQRTKCVRHHNWVPKLQK